MMVKFDREALIDYLDGTTGEVTLTVSGEVAGTPFEGSDTITVIKPRKKWTRGARERRYAMWEDWAGELCAPFSRLPFGSVNAGLLPPLRFGQMRLPSVAALRQPAARYAQPGTKRKERT